MCTDERIYSFENKAIPAKKANQYIDFDSENNKFKFKDVEELN